jgi:hypothetical protein
VDVRRHPIVVESSSFDGSSIADDVAEILDGLDGAHERASEGLEQAAAGQTVPLSRLQLAV